MLVLDPSQPRAVRWGIVALVVGLAVDLTAHLVYDGTGSAAVIGHLITLAGMLVAVAGTVWMALGRRPKEGGSRARADLAVR